MYDNNIKKIIYDTYYYLKNINIIGKERIEFINNVFKCHITSVYNWIKEFTYDFNDIYKNKYITPEIIFDIHNFIKKNKTCCLHKIKKYINKKHNTLFNTKTIGYILKVNNLNLINNKINKDVINFILDIVKKNNVIRAKDIIILIKEKFNKNISDSSVYNVLKNNKITYKKVKLITNPYSKEEEKERLLNIKSTLDILNIDNIISYDEISVTTNEYPLYGWSKSGEECNLKNKLSSIKGKRYTVGLAISNKKIVSYKIVEKGLKKNDFIDLITDITNKDIENKYTYFMDNATIHHSKEFKKLSKEKHLHVLYNAPYNSDKNPVEYVFSSLRKFIQRSIINSVEEINSAIKKFIKITNFSLYNNCFNHAFKLF